MNREQTEEQIKYIKDTFEKKLACELNLLRVSGPMIVPTNGINDDLGGSNPVKFTTANNDECEIVQSLAKWKRVRLKDFDTSKYQGIYVDMNAIRPDEQVDNLHSYYVDQWDWEMIINRDDRNLEFLYDIVNKIHKVINSFFDKEHKYPKNLYCITSQELLDQMPDFDVKTREYQIVKEHKAVFISKIGWGLSNKKPHDKRADDYDDWNLNGDLLYWSDVIQAPIEISSMGIRVNGEALTLQKMYTMTNNKLTNYHKMILMERIPFTIGGGIGQSRLCMLILQKQHIGEVQASVWPDSEIKKCEELNISLL